MNKKTYVSPVLLGGLVDGGDDEIDLPASQNHDEGPVNNPKGMSF